MIARLAIGAALIGSVLGATVVLADEPASSPKVPAVATPAASREGVQDLHAVRDVQVIRRAPDAANGAAWAVRRFTATVANGTVVTCFELGRLDGETFGWIGGNGSFTPTKPGASGPPTVCRSPAEQGSLGASTQRFTTVSLAPDETPKPLETVTFGVAAPTVATVTPRDEPPLTPDDQGVYLRIRSGQAEGPLPEIDVTYRDGHHSTNNASQAPRVHGERPLPGTGYVAVQAPDPAGGPPWAILASRGSRGGICLSLPGRLVGDQLGYLDRDLAIFLPGFFDSLRICDDKRHAPTRSYPIRMTTLVSSVDDNDPRARIERRVQDTRLVLHGRVYPDVATVTIRTPRDVRTLVPSSDAHAIIAVYDGLFPGAKVTATARFKDGHEVTRSLYTG